MDKAGTVIMTPEGLKAFVTDINIEHGTKVTVFCEGDFNNIAYIDTGAKSLTQIAQGSLSAVYRALVTFEMAYGLGRAVKPLNVPNQELDASAKNYRPSFAG